MKLSAPGYGPADTISGEIPTWVGGALQTLPIPPEQRYGIRSDSRYNLNSPNPA